MQRPQGEASVNHPSTGGVDRFGERLPTGGAKRGLRRAHAGAPGTVLRRVMMPMMDEEVADIRDPGKGVRKNEDGIALIKGGIGKK